MKQSITIVLATVIAAFSQGQDEPAPDARELIFVEPTAQELEPVENVFTYHTPDYPYRIRKILFDRAHRENEFRHLSRALMDNARLSDVEALISAWWTELRRYGLHKEIEDDKNVLETISPRIFQRLMRSEFTRSGLPELKHQMHEMEHH